MGLIQEFFAKIGELIDDFLGKFTDSAIVKSMIKVGAVFFLIIIIIIMAASCGVKRTYTYEQFLDKMVSLTKNKYKNSDKLPKSDKDVVTVQLQSFVDDETIKPIPEMLKSGENCTGEIKIINNNGYYLYIPTLNCGDKFKTVSLYDTLVNEDNVVIQGNGLYSMDNAFVFRGDNVNNYLSINDVLYRIIRINGDGTIRLLDVSKRDSVMWDNRYNLDRKYADGINSYFNNGINSRIKDVVENYYNDKIPDEIKPVFTTQDICVGKRSTTDDIFDTSIECSETIDSFPFGLIYPYEYYLASLDENCKAINNPTCRNYNYINKIAVRKKLWTAIADKETTYQVYRIESVGARLVITSGYAYPMVTAQINGEVLYQGGSGTENDPYTIKTFVEIKKKKR